MDTLSQLKKVLSENQVVTDSMSLESYGRDWCKHYPAQPSAICFPQTTEDVRKLVLWAKENKKALVPSGGRTGLSGGATASHQEVVVSLERMSKILDFNSTDRLITCQAGTITETVQEHCKEQGYYFPVDFAARGSSQIGGNIATNAGGLKVVRYGMMREWVKGLTVVTGTGEILNLKRSLIKNATGMDLKQLFIGTEGIYGIITEAVLGFTRAPKPNSVMILGLNDATHVLHLFELFMQNCTVNAFEMFTDKALSYVLSQTQMSAPLSESYKIYLLLELEAIHDTELEAVLETFAKGQEKKWIVDGTLSQSPSQAQLLWQYRERISESLAPSTPHKNDISVPISKIPEFLERIDKMVSEKYPGFEVVWFGHIGDGNLHFNVLRPANMAIAEFKSQCQHLDQQLFEVVSALDGSISAEHGVGMTKRDFLHYTRSQAEINLMRDLKQLLDPAGILNPGKLI